MVACPPSAVGALSRAVDAHLRRLGVRPSWGACAPGRVNLIGEHTDYNMGLALPMAIDRWCVAVASPGRNATASVRSEGFDDVVEFDPVMAAPAAFRAHEWASYPVGAVVHAGRLLAARGLDAPVLDITIASDVPVGSGLSSSAAVEVACISLVLAAAGADVSCREVALAAQAAEHEFAGVPCGLMDQLTSACSRPGCAMLIDFRSLETRSLSMVDQSRACILIANSGVRHALAAGAYAERRAACASAARAIGVESLRDVLDVQTQGIGLNEHMRACAQHVVSENARTLAAARALACGDFGGLGRLMCESHRSLRDDFRVSCAELDALVEIACSTPGVLGARMTGGGFGGCIVALVTRDAERAVCERLMSEYSERFGRTCSPFAVRSDGGARVIAMNAVS